MSVLKVFEENYASLVESLPMDDTIFIAKLNSVHLLPGDLKSIIESEPTSASKATKLLDQEIKPSLLNNNLIPLKNLLTAMDDIGYGGLKSLTAVMRQVVDHKTSNDNGEYMM